MNTFLPYPDFLTNAAAIDNDRLSNQGNEALIILRTLTGWYAKRGRTGWPHHHATRMWRGYEAALCEYAMAILSEVTTRDGKDVTRRGNDLIDALAEMPGQIEAWYENSFELPAWLGDPAFHASHRACLLAKDPEWYGRFGWTERATGPGADGKWPYVWPGGE